MLSLYARGEEGPPRWRAVARYLCVCASGRVPRAWQRADREDCIQDALLLAWRNYGSLLRRGRLAGVDHRSIALYALRSAVAGAGYRLGGRRRAQPTATVEPALVDAVASARNE